MFLTLTVLTVLCPPVWTAVQVVQPYRVVSTNGSAQVRCSVQPRPFSAQTLQSPHPEPEELRVTLLRGLHGPQQLCSSTLNLTETQGQVQCSAQLREGAVEVSVSGLKATDTDLYRCEIEVFYPPPYRRLTGNGTLIHVLGDSDCPEPQRQTADRADGGQEDERTPVSVPVVVLVLLVMLVLLIIIFLQALQCQRGRRDVMVPAVLQKVDAAAFPC